MIALGVVALGVVALGVVALGVVALGAGNLAQTGRRRYSSMQAVHAQVRVTRP